MTRPRRARGRPASPAQSSVPSTSTPCVRLGRQPIEQIRVVAGQLGGPGQRRRQSRDPARPPAPAAPGAGPGCGRTSGRHCADRATVSTPSSRQAASVTARGTPSSGRRNGPTRGAIPASERVPEPRARPSRTVSAWSSRVWPSSTVDPVRAASARSAAIAGVPGRRLRAAGRRRRTPTARVRRRHRAPSSWTAAPGGDVRRAGLEAVVHDDRGQRARLAVARRRSPRAASASESAPPEQATRAAPCHSRCSAACTALTSCSRAGPSARRAIRPRGRSVARRLGVHPAQPQLRIGDLGAGRQGLR